MSITSIGMNEETAKLVWSHLSKSAPSMLVGSCAAILYLSGTVWSCMACGPVRTVLLTVIAFLAQCVILYSAARNECEAKINSETVKKILTRALYPTAAFVFGYVIIPWFLPSPLILISKIGPTKVIIPAATGGLSMIAMNYILGNYISVEEICQ